MSEYAPTPRKLKRARQDGKVVKSPLLTQIVVLLGTISALYVLLSYGWVRIKILLEYTLGPGLQSPAEVARLWGQVGLFTVLCLLAVSLVLGILAEVSQVGFHISFVPLKLRFERILGVDGFPRLFSSIREAWEPFLRLILLLVLLYLFFQRVLVQIASTITAGPRLSLNWLSAQLQYAMTLSSVLLVIFALSEYILKRRRFDKQMRMTRDELMREVKEDEGDPHIKFNRKALHRAMIYQELVKRVRSSKMIIVKKRE